MSPLPQLIAIYVNDNPMCAISCSQDRAAVNAANGGAFAIAITGVNGQRFYGNFNGAGGEQYGNQVIYRFYT